MNITLKIQQWKEGFISANELMSILETMNIHGTIEDGTLIAYDYDNQEWITDER